MHKQDIGLTVAMAAVLALLLAVTAIRPTPDQRNIAVILYVIGGVLEAAGVATIGLDLRARHKRTQEFFWRVRALGRPAVPASATESVDQRLVALERVAIQQRTQTRMMFAHFMEMVGVWETNEVAWLGFGALLLGVVVGTVANIVSVTA